jgi:hypothetical protein
MTTVPTTLFPCYAAFAVHRLDARQAHPVVATADDVAFEALVADQIAARAAFRNP